MKAGVIGSGSIGLGYAAWMANRGHNVIIWSPSGGGADGFRTEPLQSVGALEAACRISVVDSAAELAAQADVLLIAVPVNFHRRVMDALLSHLRPDQLVIVSSMGSLSALYLYESARMRGVAIDVASFGTTALTARRESPTRVRIMLRRESLSVSCLPYARHDNALIACASLFGKGFTPERNVLATTLSNTNPVAHVPLAILNWTRIERRENWPQYHFMTPRVASIIENLDAERIAVAKAFGLDVHRIEEHFAKSFQTRSVDLASIASELHEKRGGPPGPTNVQTRYLSEDVPYGLVFTQSLCRIAGIHSPATDTTAAMASLIVGKDFAAMNDLISPLNLAQETVSSLMQRLEDTA